MNIYTYNVKLQFKDGSIEDLGTVAVSGLTQTLDLSRAALMDAQSRMEMSSTPGFLQYAGVMFPASDVRALRVELLQVVEAP